MKEDRIWILLAKKESGEATSDELAELEILMKADESTGFSENLINKIWDLPLTTLQNQAQENKTAIWNKIEERLPTTHTPVVISTFKKLMIAATLLALLTGGTLYYFHLNKDNKDNQITLNAHINQVSTQKGSRTKIILPDGTKVWLNASSKLAYKNDFNTAPDREVTLSGEAFFEVVHDAGRPFIIHAKGIVIRDIGTSFDIKAYPGEKTVEATLISGAIEITSGRDPEINVLLKPNERMIIPVDNAQNNTISKEASDSSSAETLYSIAKVQKDQYGLISQTSWVQNKLVFDDETFEDLAPKMERWYNIHIHFKSDLIQQIRFSGIIEKESIGQALKAMQLSYPFKYTISGNDVFISNK